MDKLIDGYRRFRSGRYLEQRALYGRLADGQAPRLLVIACSDSRVDPATIFDVAPGEIFIVRNVANLVPPCEQGDGLHGTSAAIEFAVEQLQVKTILVLGHARCGGVSAALGPTPPRGGHGFLAAWIGLLDEARAQLPGVSDDPQRALELQSILVSLERLRSFPFVATAEAAGRLELVGARFDIATGALEVYDRSRTGFELVF
jgi:carbonic anhydrase